MISSLRRPALVVPLALAATFGCGSSTDGAARNVLLISIDTCRADRLGCYGFEKPTTPSIDALAAEGVRFSRAQSTAPLTLPAHSSLLTGQIPPAHGVHSNESRGLGPVSVTVAEMLSGAGFQTAAFVGAFPLDAAFGLDQGFDTYDDDFSGKTGKVFFNERRAEDVSAAGIEWLRANGEEPFFLFLHYFDPHGPYDPPEPYARKFPGDPYAAEIAYTDASIGRVIEDLKALDLYDSTLVIVTADHGEALGEHGERTHGYFAYQSTIHVPLVVRAPGSQLREREVTDAVSHVDIVPTILDFTDTAPKGTKLAGTSLRPYFESEETHLPPRALYSESLMPAQYGCQPLVGFVQDPWHYLGPAGPELYDLDADPEQLRDLGSAQSDRTDELGAHLEQIVAKAAESGAGASNEPLDAETLERLQALGYFGGAAAPAELAGGADREDPRAFFPIYKQMIEAEALYGAARYDEAEVICRAVLAERPELVRMNYVLGRVALDQGLTDVAIAEFEAMLRGASDESRLQGPNSDHEIGLAHSQLAHAHHGHGDLKQAQHHYREALARIPSTSLQLNLADALRDSGRLSEARTMLKELLNARPDHAQAHHQLALLYILEGNSSSARTHFEKALAVDSNLIESHFNLGVLYDQHNEIERAREQFAAALALDGEHRGANHGLGMILAREGDFSRAITHFERALETDPEFEPARAALLETKAKLTRIKPQ